MCAHAVRLLRSSRIPATVESLHRDVKKSGMDPLEYFITAFTEKNRIVVGMPCSSEGGLSLVLPFFETVISELQALGKHPRLLLPCPDTYESSLNDLDQGVVADFDLVGEALAMPDEPDEAFDRAVRARISDFLGRVRPKVKIVCYGSDFIKDRAPEDADVRNIVFTSIRTPGERKSVNQNVILITEAELTSFGMHSHWEAPLVVLPEKFPRTKSFALRVVSSSMTAQILDDIKIGAFDTLIYLRERTQ
jgi:hypothetical protein